MALRRIYSKSRNAVTVTLYDGLADRLSRPSDIQEYLPFLYEQAHSRPGCCIVELGTRNGNSTLAFLAGVAESGGTVWSVDVDNIILNDDGMWRWQNARNWRFIHGSDMDEGVQAMLPEKIDILFIDTSHEYEHTLAELRTYIPRLTPDGIALLHDTKVIVEHWLPGAPRRDVPPVRQAIDAYCSETGLTWEDLDGRYGLGVIHGGQ